MTQVHAKILGGGMQEAVDKIYENLEAAESCFRDGVSLMNETMDVIQEFVDVNEEMFEGHEGNFGFYTAPEYKFLQKELPVQEKNVKAFLRKYGKADADSKRVLGAAVDFLMTLRRL